MVDRWIYDGQPLDALGLTAEQFNALTLGELANHAWDRGYQIVVKTDDTDEAGERDNFFHFVLVPRPDVQMGRVSFGLS